MTVDLQTLPPLLPGDVSRVFPKTGLPSEATLDFEEAQNAWYTASVTDLQTQSTTIKSQTDANSASITTETQARTSADEAFAAQLVTVSTTVGQQTAAISSLTYSVNGIAAGYVLKATLNGGTGSFEFAGVQRADGTGPVFTATFNSNVLINGNLIVTGTINTQQVTYSAVNNAYVAGLGGNQSYGVNNNWVDVLTVGYSGSDGAYARIDAIIGVARFVSGSGNISYGRCRVVSDVFGDLTGSLYLNYGVVDGGGNANDAANGYITNPLAAMVFGINGGDTIRLQFRNIPGGGSGIVYWLNNQTKLLVEVRKR